MQVKFFLTLLGIGALTLIDGKAEAQNKKHIKIIEIVDGDTTITEKTIDAKNTAAAKKEDKNNTTFAYSYSTSDDKSSAKKSVSRSSKNETMQISIDMDDESENFKTVILKNDTEKKNVFQLEVQTNKDKPFDLELKDDSGKPVYSKTFSTGKKLDERLDFSKQKKGGYTLTVKQGSETVSSHTLTID